MKILQNNDSELEIKSSGIIGLIVGIAVAIIGVGVAVYPLFATAEWWVSLIGLAFMGVGGAMVFTASSTRTVLRKAGTSRITEKRLIGGATKEATFESTQVAHVMLESHTEYSSSGSSSGSRNGERQRQRVSNLYVVLQDGTEITVGSERVNGNGGFSVNGIGLSSISKNPLIAEAQQIADFFGVELKTGVHDASLQDIVGAVQTAFTKPAGQTGTVPTIPPSPTPVVAPSNSTPTAPENSTNPQV